MDYDETCIGLIVSSGRWDCYCNVLVIYFGYETLLWIGFGINDYKYV